MHQEQFSRRSVLQWGSIIAGSSLAGCIGEVPLADDDSSTEDDGFGGAVPLAGDGSSPSAYRSWVIDPALFNQEQHTVAVTTPPTVADYADNIRQADWENYLNFAVNRFEFTRFRPDSLDRVIVVFPHYSVALGDFDVEQIGSDLRQNDYSLMQEDERYDIYMRNDERRAVGLSGDQLIFVHPLASNPGQIVRFIIDANAGEEQRYHDVNPGFETLTEAMPGGDIVFGSASIPGEESDMESERLRNTVAGGFSYSLTGEETDTVLTLVFVDEDDVIERDIEEWMQSTDAFNTWQDIEISTNGRIATITGVAQTRELFATAAFDF